MNILVLNGSPKSISDTMHVTNSFVEGMNVNNEHDIEIINVIEKDISPCRGCFGCWQKQEGRCVINDDLNEILAKIVKSDMVIWSFPLYCYGMPSHLKAVLDRTIPLSKINMRTEGDRVVHDSQVEINCQHIMISGCGFPNFEDNFKPEIMAFKNCFGKDALTICISETPMLNVPEAKPLADMLLQKIKAAGEEFNRDKKLSDITKQIIETPMIPNEQYIQIVNGQ